MSGTRLNIICDFAEEGWPSMDLAADSLIRHLRPMKTMDVQRVRPTLRRRFSRMPFIGSTGASRNADRLINRLHDYPRLLRRSFGSSSDLFHVVDHSYSQLIHELPPQRT